MTRFLRTRWTGAGRDSGFVGIADNGGAVVPYSGTAVATESAATGRPDRDLMHAPIAFRLRAPDDFSRIDWLYGDRVA